MTSDRSPPTDPQHPPLFATDPVEAAIARHQGTQQDLQHAAAAMDAADRASRQVEAEADAAFSAASAADGAAWADLLATRPDDVPGAVRLLRYVSGSPASETVEDPQDLLRQLTAAVEAAEASRLAGSEPSANLPEVGSTPDPAFAAVAEYRAAWDAAEVATREGNGDVPEEASEAMMEAYDRLRAVRPTTAAGYRALAAIWAWRQAQDGEPGDTLGEQIAESLIAGAGVCVPGATDAPVSPALADLIARHRDLVQRSEARGISDAEADPLFDEAWNLFRQACSFPIAGPADLAAKLDLMAAEITEGVERGDVETATHAWNCLRADLLTFGGVRFAGPAEEPVDWHAPPPGFMASPAIEPFGFVLIPEGIAIEIGRLRGIAVAEFERIREAGATGDRLERLRRSLHLDALSKAARGEGSFDVPVSAPRDWHAYAARHPGFVPYPAHAPSALMALDLAIRGEAERLLALAEEEIARRRQDYAGHPDPDVWPRVERSLRREMRMEALAAVASDLPDDDGAPDPALAAIAASRRAEAEMAAFGESTPARLTRTMQKREEVLSKAQVETRLAAWATVPTTRMGRLALVDFARFQVEIHRAPDGEVDSAGDLLSDILDALAAAIAAERPEEVSAADPSNLDALTLVSAIEAEWAVLARINENDWDEGAYTRRDALLAAADRLPADTREARHAKALALAWIMYADLWEANRTRGDYSTNGRLAVDIHASLTNGSTTEQPDAALLALGPTIVALIAAQDAVPSEEEDAYAKIDGLVMAETRRLAGLRARTLDGLVLKARFVERGADEELKDAIVSDLLALGGGR